MKKKSLKLNLFIYTVKQLMSIIFPLITFPYASRVLGVEGIGKISYSKSLTTYFVLIAGLGIKSYATMEGAKLRENKNGFSIFASQMLFINIVSSVLSTTVFLLIINEKTFFEYRELLIIYSFLIPFTTLGMEWVFIVYEDFLYIAIRSILFHIISILLMVMLVKGPDDYVWYALVMTFSTVAPNIINMIVSHKYFSFKIDRPLHCSEHLKPIFLIFGIDVASEVYLTMDTSLTGYLCGDWSTGIYSTANKFVILITTLLAALRTVMLPRLSYELGKGVKNTFSYLNEQMLQFIMCLVVPISIGVALMSTNLIVSICGEEFTDAGLTLRLLSPEIVLSAINGFIVYQIFLPQGEEKKAFMATCIGALVNLTFDMICIPIWHENGAAIGTCIAEMSLLTYCLIVGRSMIDLSIVSRNFWKVLIGCLGITVFCYIVNNKFCSSIVLIIFTISISAIIYILIELLLNNEYINGIIASFLKKGKKHEQNYN